MRFRPALAAAAASLLIAAPAATAASVAYIDSDYNAWLSSPDGTQKFQLTQGGTQDASWNWPAQGPDGKTVVVHRDTFDGGEKRPVLYLYGPDGKLQKANVMPVYSGATIPVYPIGLDMDWHSNAVAYGYSYCGFACNTTYRGYWLTFSDNQGAFPTNPQGQSGFYFPTFVGTRVISSDDAGHLFVQPDVPEAPFTNSYTGWLDAGPGYRIQRASVAQTGRMMAVDWTQVDGGGTQVDQGIWIGQHQGTVPSDFGDYCRLPAAAEPRQLTFSPDATQIAWQDAEGVKVAGVPNLAAGTPDCALSAPAKVIAPGGNNPHFGGADVAAILKPATPAPTGPAPSNPTGPGTGTSGTGTPPNTTTPALTLPSRVTRATLAKGLRLAITVPAAGRVDASGSIPASVARRLGLRAPRAVAAGARGFAAASSVVIARGRATAKGAGKITVTLRPTAAARPKLRRMRGVKLTLRVSQGARQANRTITLR